MNPDTPLPYQRPCASRSTSTRRCTRTGTSWPTIAQRRFGVDAARTTSQVTWEIDRARARAAAARCVDETHSAEQVLAAEPYPGAVETIRALARRRATSSTSPSTAPPTRTRTPRSGWTRSACPYDELYCSYDKIARCVEIGIDVLIDDSPVNARQRACEPGITAATLEHPWNRELSRRDVICAPDWPTLAQRLRAACCA